MMKQQLARALGGVLLLGAAALTACGEDAVAVVDDDDRELAAEIRVLSGADQSGTPGTALGEPIEVEVRDVIRRRIGGAEIIFEPMEGHGTVSSDTILANSLGRATTIWTLGPATGEQILRVHADTVTIQITATAEGAAGILP